MSKKSDAVAKKSNGKKSNGKKSGAAPKKGDGDGKKGDRRHEPRVAAMDLVHVEEYAYPPLGTYKTDDAIGRTRDLSHDGMCLVLDHPLHLGTRVRVDLALGNAILKLTGRVTSVREAGKKSYEMGVEFKGVKPEEYESLDSYLHLRGD